MKKLFILLSVAALLTACGKNSQNTASGTASELYAATTDSESGASIISDSPAEGELTVYEGVLLGSVNDFRENSIKGVQNIDAEDYTLVIDGLVKNTLALTYDDLTNFPQETRLTTIYCVEGWDVTILWEGIALADLFSLADPQKTAKTVVFHSEDGYTTSVSLEYALTNDLIIADKANGITLPDHLGFPFILVAEDKWGYKWARWITEIELSSEENYLGYWEKRGYSQTADLENYYFD